MIKKTIPTLALALFAAGLSVASAATNVVNVDINGGAFFSPNNNSYVGQGALSDPGNNTWNYIIDNPNGTTNNVLFSDGTASGISVTLSGFEFSYSGYDETNNSLSGPTSNNPHRNLLADFAGVGGTNVGTLNLNSLSANGLYDLYLYGVSNAGNRVTQFTINNVSQQTSDLLANTTDFTLGGDYVVFQNITASALGNIQVSIQRFGSSSEGDFNGFQLKAVPEPSTTAALGLGMFGLIAVGVYRRRRLA